MSFSRITATRYNDNEAARFAVDAVNQLIGEVADEDGAIASDADALVADALVAEPKDASKLVKRGEALRVRSLGNLLRELRIVPLKKDAQVAIRAAAAAEAEVQGRALVRHEDTIRKSALALGYSEGERSFTQLFTTDPTRQAILQVKSRARLDSNNVHTLTPDDHAHAAALRAAVTRALK